MVLVVVVFLGGLTIFERRIRHLKRYREIAVAFTRNGFGYIVKELGLHELIPLPKRLVAKRRRDKTTGERIRFFLEELGPTFVKMGQFASTRSDVIPEDIIQELEKLQDQVPPNPYPDVKAIIEQELGTPTEELFKEFHEVPLGSASIGQVHYAVLKSGEKVAVKVQRPNIEQVIKTDLEVLQQLAVLAEFRLKWAARYQIKGIVEEFSKALLAELDYTLEARNADKIARQFTDDPNIRIPDVYSDYSTKKVLTMEYVDGIKLNKIEELHQKGYDTKVVAERFTRAVFHQVFIEGFFHGDPHPSNISALPGNKILFMDFGMVGRLTPEMKGHFGTLVIALMRQSSDGIIKAITRMGLVPDDVDIQLLREDVDQLREKYYDIPLSKVSIGEPVNDLFSIAHQYHIQLPSELTLLGKTLLTMEGIVEKLDPDLSIVKMAEPFGRQLLKERYQPKKLAETFFNQWSEFGEILTDIPQNIKDVTSILKKGKLPVEISIDKAEVFLNKLNRISNRLSFSIVLLSFSIIMVGLIIGSALSGQSSLLWDIPAIEIGFGVAILMFIWLLYSIFKSGRF
ncbi:ubiquinone biosynthesis protein [Virgibacillus halotolerans]|nr:AarF/ABC1/UbiB kinase family protein [Virgibacillus halotolerans]MBM7600978.1 ubiquinone biosynthesis protein [Virgibacillus halotolerans]